MLGRVAQDRHTLGKAGQQGPPLWPSSSVYVLLAEVSKFSDASLQGASLCFRAALLSSSLGSATCPVTLGSFLHEIFHQLDSSTSFLHKIFH